MSFGVFGELKSAKMTELGLKPYFQIDGYQGKAYYQLDDVSVVAITDSSDCGCADPIVEKEGSEQG